MAPPPGPGYGLGFLGKLDADREAGMEELDSDMEEI